MLKRTPFHFRTAALMQADQWRRWAGYTAASAYEMTHDREYLALRNACVQIEEVSEQIATLALQGPRSRELLMTLTDAPLSDLKYYRFLNTTIADTPMMISRTGYTGDL